MSGNNIINDADFLDQFLRECEPPTPPATVPSSLQFPVPFADMLSGSNTTESPSSANGSFLLEDIDKREILQSIDASELSSIRVPNVSCTEFLRIVNESISLNHEDVKAHKLAMQRAKANKRRNRHRQKVKDEWQTLRMQNAQLSEQLAAMKRARLDTGESVAQLKWQAIASLELEARRQAEAQQLSVRTAIDGRAAEIAKFQEFMNEHEQTSAVESGEEHEWMPDDFKLYKNFMMEIKAAYKRTDAVLNDCGLAETIPSCTSFYKPIRRKDELRNINYFESTSAFSLPCPYSKAANAMFESMRQVHRQNPHRRLFETAENLSNTIAVKLGTIYHYEGGNPVPLSLILVMQRFVEPGRTVLIWRGLIQGYGDFTGTFLDSTGWCVLRPTSSGGVDSTDVRTCIHLMPTQIPSQKQLERNERLVDPQEFADVTVRSSQRDKLELARVMQQLLLD